MDSAARAVIRVDVESQFLPEHSDPTRGEYLFTYRVRIRNEGLLPAQLISRHWIITDALGQTEEVRGEGVIGEQPRLESGQTFEYRSFCPLPTSMGSMTGSYRLRHDDGSEFDAEIPAFTLATPQSLN